MTLKLLKAENGDAIILSYQDDQGVNRNILIDGGTSRSYKYKNLKGKVEDGQLKKEIDQILSKGEVIDLLVVTHVDDDHIGGILKWIESNDSFDELVKNIWFNSGSLIYKFFNHEENNENDIAISITDNKNTSISQGVSFENYITKKGKWSQEVTLQGQKIQFHGLEFKILTPSKSKLMNLLCKWRNESSAPLTSKQNDYNKSISELIRSDVFVEDDKAHNGSSISFIIEYSERKILLLGDAHPSDVVSGLKYWGFSNENKLRAEIVKVSHHGSKKNTSYELLNHIDSNFYLISSNGAIHNLPDKLCIARIINKNRKVSLGFNYKNMLGNYIRR